ncbi:MAG: hypothetical protein H0V09_10350 [Gemmatimonadetes bacterium]|nr:hypothetical protein [Gemmatimonadota bacterium]
MTGVACQRWLEMPEPDEAPRLRADHSDPHLEHCDGCRRAVRALDHGRRILHQLSPPPTSSDFLSRLETRIDRLEEGRRRTRQRMRLGMRTAHALLAVALTTLVVAEMRDVARGREGPGTAAMWASGLPESAPAVALLRPFSALSGVGEMALFSVSSAGPSAHAPTPDWPALDWPGLDSASLHGKARGQAVRATLGLHPSPAWTFAAAPVSFRVAALTEQ